MENPYESPPPTVDFTTAGYGAATMPAGARPRGMVGHVRVLAILMIVQGALSLLVGLMWAGMAIFICVMFSVDPPPTPPGGGPTPLVMFLIIGGTYGTMGLCGIIPGIGQAYTGWKAYKFQSRSPAMVWLVVGVAASLTCYCAPTSILLMIYGLIVFLNDSVREAFELAKQGHSPDQIDAMFNPWTYQQPNYYPPPKPPEL